LHHPPSSTKPGTFSITEDEANGQDQVLPIQGDGDRDLHLIDGMQILR
jgi:hypothetical protein